MFVEETHSKEGEVSFLVNCGVKAYFSHGTSRTAGVAVLIKNFPGHVIIYFPGGYNKRKENQSLFIELTFKLEQLKLTHWIGNIIGGDFNLVID